MVMDFFRGTKGSSIEHVEATLVSMLRDAKTVYDAATSAVFGGGKSKETKREVKGTDRQINQAQQEVRRALMIHSSVVGNVDLPLVLAYMSVVKDVERAGDYAKNLYDIAKYGADFSTAPDREELEGYCDAVGRLMDEAAAVFEERDIERAQQLVAKADTFLDQYDDHVTAMVQSEGSAFDAVTRALYYRYLKRITAHVMNLMTSLTLPVDQLDYYDEVKEDRD
jgi:phosphate uptake regulator